MNTKLNIGITIYIQDENESIFLNGIKQNAIFLAKTFLNIKKDYNIYIVNASNIKITQNIGWDLDKYKTVQYNDIKDEIDILFLLGGSLNKQEVEYLRNRKCLVVPYKCGNEYIISMENVLFDRTVNKWDQIEYDQIWNIPQMENTNSYFWKVLNRTETITIPFVWDPMFLDMHINELKNQGKNPYYIPTNKPKRISIFEPNLNVYKYCLYPILIIENTYRQKPELIEKMYVTNTKKIRIKQEFIDLMKCLDIVNHGKASFEDRFPIVWFLTDYTDVVIAHQWENALNYAYLDAIYLGYPLVHNAHLCKECGYYYDGFNIDDGSEKLLYALEKHDNNIEEYDYNTKLTLDKYLSDNEYNIICYDKLIEKLLKK